MLILRSTAKAAWEDLLRLLFQVISRQTDVQQDPENVAWWIEKHFSKWIKRLQESRCFYLCSTQLWSLKTPC